MYPGDVSTFGGVVTDEHARVLREDGSVIAGLYATGTSTASVMGAGRAGRGRQYRPVIHLGLCRGKTRRARRWWLIHCDLNRPESNLKITPMRRYLSKRKLE